MKKITLKEYECTPHTKTIFTREIDDNLPDFYCVDCGQSLDWDN